MSSSKSYSHFFSKKFQNICVSLDVNFNESLTNDVVSFEQLGPERQTLANSVDPDWMLLSAVLPFIHTLISDIFRQSADSKIELFKFKDKNIKELRCPNS